MPKNDPNSTKELLVQGIKNLIKPEDITEVKELIRGDRAVLEVDTTKPHFKKFRVDLYKSGEVWEIDDIAGYVAQVGMFAGGSGTGVYLKTDPKLKGLKPKTVFTRFVKDLQKVNDFADFEELAKRYGTNRMNLRLKGIAAMITNMGPLMEHMTKAFLESTK
jgi:hypothetical protein